MRRFYFWILLLPLEDLQPVTQKARGLLGSEAARRELKMRLLRRLCWVLCLTSFGVGAAPKPSGETADHGNKDIDDLDDGHADIQSTLSPSDLSVDLPENWDQTKDDSQSLFLNKSDKNDLEPYPMALSDDAADAYDGQLIAGNESKMSSKARAGIMEHVLMRAELYGEPPSMGRQPSRRKRADQSFRSGLSSGNSRVSKRGTRYSTSRMKRDTNMRSEDILALLSLWDAQQRRNKEATYYSPASYYGQNGPYDEVLDGVDMEDKWMDEPVVPSAHFSNYYDVNSLYGDKPSHYKYVQNYPDYISEDPNYLQHLEALRRKRQWAGFGNKNRVAKRFMVAKKRAEPNQYYYSQKSYKPREDLYSLGELLKSAQGGRDQGIPLTRRMVL